MKFRMVLIEINKVAITTAACAAANELRMSQLASL